jgi:shikimate kinase
MKRIWLIGMMGSGKTSAGRRAADHLGVRFTDTDEMVEALDGRPVREIWSLEGEESFRALEREVVSSLDQVDGIIATGGGVVLDEENRVRMQGMVVWLEARPSTIVARLGDDRTRPLAAGPGSPEERVALILAERSPIYQALATHRVETDRRDIGDVAEAIIGLWGG